MGEGPSPNNIYLWRLIAGCAVSLLLGVLSGQYIPNRNIVTNDQLNTALAPMQTSLAAQSVQISTLTVEVSELRGELKGKKAIQ